MVSRRIRRAFLWIPAVVWAAGIIVMSTINHPKFEDPSVFLLSDKAAHFFIYALLAFLLIRPFRHVCGDSRRATVLVASFLTATAYGILMELYQSLVGRTMDVSDMVANTLGVFAAVLGYVVWHTTRRRRLPEG
jgi:VanZ family protein